MFPEKTPSGHLWQCLIRTTTPAAKAWLASMVAELAARPTKRTIDVAFGLAPRRLGKDDIRFSPADLARAEAVRPGWRPDGLSADQAGRIILLSSLARPTDFAETFARLSRTGDPAEQIALYLGLPVYPYAHDVVDIVAEGLRTNIRPVFEAIAHANPYPAETFDEHRWNHMVLKALFIGSRLEPIAQRGRRNNRQLASMLADYARERTAAGRPVPLELWDWVAPFAGGADRDTEPQP